jgi:hypothetical protein
MLRSKLVRLQRLQRIEQPLPDAHEAVVLGALGAARDHKDCCCWKKSWFPLAQKYSQCGEFG